MAIDLRLTALAILIAGATPSTTRAADSFDPRLPISIAAESFARFGEAPVKTTDIASPIWSELPPPQRAYGSTTYDPLRDELLLYAGLIYPYRSQASNETWRQELSASPPGWTRIEVSGDVPPLMANQDMIYDPVRDRMIMVFAGGYYGVWAMSLSDGVWQQLAPPYGPPLAWYGSTTVYDSRRNRLVVFGGYTPGPHIPPASNQAMALSLEPGGTWDPIATQGTLPTPRYDHAAMYDPVTDRMVIFGGVRPTSTVNRETWVLDFSAGSTWVQLAPGGAIPGIPSTGWLSAYDPDTRQFVLLAENDPGYIWTFELDGPPTWAHIATSGAAPAIYPPSAGLDFDLIRHHLVFYDRGETWALTLGSPPTWTELSSPPPGRAHHAAICDPTDDQMVIFGGEQTPGGASFRNDTWAKELGPGGSWKMLAPTGPRPSPRIETAAISDPARHSMVVFGGLGATDLSDTWELSLGAAPSWTQLAPGGATAPARWGSAFTYDSSREALIVIGGRTQTAYWNDVWRLSLSGQPTWAQLATNGISPSQRSNATAVYDSKRDRILLIGGRSPAGPTDTVWALSLGGSPTWSRLDATGSPGSRIYHSAIYDPTSDAVLVFGGSGPVNEVWELLLAGSPQWTVLVPAGAQPTARFGQSGVYDAVIHRFIVFGGYQDGASSTTPASDDAWALQLADAATPVLASLIGAEVEPTLVRVTWESATAAEATLRVYRNEGEGWVTASTTPDVRGDRIVYEDRNVLPGGRYGYRIGLDVGIGEEVTGEVWVSVPARSRFSLAGVVPNPPVADLNVSFSLPDASPATLELLDVSGRRILERSVGALGTGDHVVDLGPSRRLAAGLYLVRLRQGSRSTMSKVCLVR